MITESFSGVRYYYIWETKEPEEHIDRSSPVFLLHGVKWHFQLFTEINEDDMEEWFMCIVFHSVPQPVWEINTYVQLVSGELELIAHVYENFLFHRGCHKPYCTTIMSEIMLKINRKDYLINGSYTFLITLDDAISKMPEVKKKAIIGKPEEEILCLEQLSDDIKSLFVSLEHSDVVLKCGGQSFPAHRQILASRSEVFAAMLRAEMPDGRQTGVIDIVDMDLDILKIFIAFLYSGKVDVSSVDTAIKLYEVSHKYSVLSLRQKCETFLSDNLTIDVVCPLLTVAGRYGDKKMLNDVAEFACKEKTFLASAEWLAFAEQNPELSVKVFIKYHRRIAIEIL